MLRIERVPKDSEHWCPTYCANGISVIFQKEQNILWQNSGSNRTHEEIFVLNHCRDDFFELIIWQNALKKRKATQLSKLRYFFKNMW